MAKLSKTKADADLNNICAHIRSVGPTEVAHRTKVSRRTLHNILNGRPCTYKVFRALMEDMGR